MTKKTRTNDNFRNTENITFSIRLPKKHVATLKRAAKKFADGNVSRYIREKLAVNRV